MKRDILFEGLRMICLTALLAGFAPLAFAAPAETKPGSKNISEANSNYRIVTEKIRGISGGVTTEKEVTEMFGKPFQVLDSPKPPRLGGGWWWKAIKDGEYLAPKDGRKIFVYEYTYYRTYAPSLIKGENLQLFITINKKTGVVEFFAQFVRPLGGK